MVINNHGLQLAVSATVNFCRLKRLVSVLFHLSANENVTRFESSLVHSETFLAVEIIFPWEENAGDNSIDIFLNIEIFRGRWRKEDKRKYTVLKWDYATCNFGAN